MRIRVQRWFALLLLVMTTVVPAATLSAQTAAMRSRLDGVIAAFNGTAEEFEKHAREAYAQAFLESSSAEARQSFYNRVRGDFGLLKIEKVERESPSSVRVTFSGSKGARGAVRLDHQVEEPHKLTAMQIEIAEEEAPPLPIHAGMSGEEIAAALEPYLQELTKADRFAGTVLIARDGKPVVEKAYGMADRANRVPNTVQTRYNIGSINKHFTRISLARLMSA
ncbi:MAG TPA: serine hydrolase, partial [Thermoanaerobaculia bacterium]